jgi:hypothetical protein
MFQAGQLINEGVLFGLLDQLWLLCFFWCVLHVCSLSTVDQGNTAEPGG